MARSWLAALLLLTLAGCGDVPADDPSDAGPQGAAARAADLPPCQEVWVAGETLPADYEGCMRGDILTFADENACDDGSRVITYEESYWAVAGEEISSVPSGGLDDDPDLAAALEDC